jgi:hypothetical protein
MHEMRCLMQAVRCLMHEMRCLMQVVRCLMHEMRCLMQVVCYSTQDPCCLVLQSQLELCSHSQQMTPCLQSIPTIGTCCLSGVLDKATLNNYVR